MISVDLSLDTQTVMTFGHTKDHSADLSVTHKISVDPWTH